MSERDEIDVAEDADVADAAEALAVRYGGLQEMSEIQVGDRVWVVFPNEYALRATVLDVDGRNRVWVELDVNYGVTRFTEDPELRRVCFPAKNIWPITLPFQKIAIARRVEELEEWLKAAALQPGRFGNQMIEDWRKEISLLYKRRREIDAHD